MSDYTEDDSVACSFAVYRPPIPGLPWLAVCFGPNRQVIDAQAFATLEDAHIVARKAQEILLERMQRKFGQSNDDLAH